jgi:hypothetical protein
VRDDVEARIAEPALEHGWVCPRRLTQRLIVCEARPYARLSASKMLGGASQIVSMIRVKCNGKRKLTSSPWA